ncbi:MAG: NADPH-dependent 7-cyano-7-deazaguanine reductase QueF [Gammaproteobacteria bacterium]
MVPTTLQPHASQLGKKTSYDSIYNPDKLFPILRSEKRKEIGITDALPFVGRDYWSHYEVSWLNEKGKPMVALAKISYACDSPFLIESKSMKLYFNSLNNTAFKNIDVLTQTIKKDLEERIQLEVNVELLPLDSLNEMTVYLHLEGTSLDTLDVTCSVYTVHPDYLVTENKLVEETLCSDLLRSNCLVTGQPDWGSVQIAYKGHQMNHEGLLKYIISFRNHIEFGEHCVERMFMDITKHCQPEELSVYACFTRRGGIDISAFRSTSEMKCSSATKRICRM